MALHSLLAEHLLGRPRVELPAADSIQCAVLIPLFAGDGEYEVLYTLRSEELPSHKGQVAFPGGKRTAGDPTLAHTALREAHEEVGLDPAAVEIIGCLDDVYTMGTVFRVTPFLGLIPPGYPFTPDPSEVAQLFCVPLSRLADRSAHGVETRAYNGSEFQIDRIRAGPHTIWGLTHRITMNLLECIEAVDSVRKP